MTTSKWEKWTQNMCEFCKLNYYFIIWIYLKSVIHINIGLFFVVVLEVSLDMILHKCALTQAYSKRVCSEAPGTLLWPRDIRSAARVKSRRATLCAAEMSAHTLKMTASVQFISKLLRKSSCATSSLFNTGHKTQRNTIDYRTIRNKDGKSHKRNVSDYFILCALFFDISLLCLIWFDISLVFDGPYNI